MKGLKLIKIQAKDLTHIRFTSHYKPLSVAIKLDIPADEAEKYYQDYVRLSDFGYLEDMISDNGDLRPFLTLYNELKSRSLDDLNEIITISRNIPIIKSYNNELNNAPTESRK